jgi:predicted enzyme related to lactoylglutathione lyase
MPYRAYARAVAHNIVHFAIHADDVERARRFYEAVFGWRFEAWGPPGFYDVTTGDDDHPGIHGALHGRDVALTGAGTRGFTCTVAVEDLLPIREKVIANGGTITYDEVAIPTVGTLTQFLDTEGNELAAMVYDTDMFGA